MVEGGALPQSLESERAVLGGLMLDPQQCLVIAETLKPEDFFRDAHAKLYALMVSMAEANKPTEMVAVIDQVIASNSAEEVGGLDYVMSLSDNVPSTQNLEYFANVVEQRVVVDDLVAVAPDDRLHLLCQLQLVVVEPLEPADVLCHRIPVRLRGVRAVLLHQ